MRMQNKLCLYAECNLCIGQKRKQKARERKKTNKYAEQTHLTTKTNGNDNCMQKTTTYEWTNECEERQKPFSYVCVYLSHACNRQNCIKWRKLLFYVSFTQMLCVIACVCRTIYKLLLRCFFHFRLPIQQIFQQRWIHDFALHNYDGKKDAPRTHAEKRTS